MAIKNSVGYDSESSATIFAPESTNPIGSKAKFLNVTAFTVPAFSNVK